MKISEKVSKINKYIEDIKEWQWLLITFFICLIFMVLVSVEIIWLPFIHAEDGPVFLKEALEEGRYSLFNIFSGYLGILPRIFAITAIHFGRKYNSMIVVTFIMKTFSTLFSVIAVNYFNSKTFKNIINSRILRLMMSLLLMYVMANHLFILYNSVMTHWWGALLVMYIGFNFLEKKLPPIYIIPFLILSILSSPTTLIIILPTAYYVFCRLKGKKIKDIKIKNKSEVVIVMLITITVIMHVFVILFMGKKIISSSANVSSITINYIILTLYKTIKYMIQCIPYIITFGKLTVENIRIVLGVILFAILGWRYYKNKNLKMFIWGVFGIFAIYFMKILRYQEKFSLPSITFYDAVPSTMGVLLLMKWIYDDLQKVIKNKRIFEVIMFIILSILTFAYYKTTYKNDFTNCKEIYKIESKVDFKSKKIKKIKIPGLGNWKAYVPVKK